MQKDVNNVDEFNIKKNICKKPTKLSKKSAKSIEKKSSFHSDDNEVWLDETLKERFAMFPENKRRTVNKIVEKGNYFNIIYNLNENKFEIKKNDILIYSAIPYDTSRKYIQRAAILTILYPEETIKYLKQHQQNIIKYIEISIRQVGRSKSEAKKYYDALYERPLFMMQILGRMFQHDETGPLSANLPGKFLYDVNQNTGITGYLVEFIKFLVKATKELPIITDGDKVSLIESSKNKKLDGPMYKQSFLSNNSVINFNLLPEPIQTEMKKELLAVDDLSLDITKPMLQNEFGTAVQNTRKNYVAHSIPPYTLEPIFTNVLPTKNNNKINVVSDIHSLDGKLPFQNSNFNILVGDISDSNVSDSMMHGIAVIGNHELSDLIPKHGEVSEEFEEFKKLTWYKRLQNEANDAWPLLPVGNHKIYEIIKKIMSVNFPNMKILNNESYIYNGIRYIGLTVPVALTKRKLEVQIFIWDSLSKLLNDDYQTPTVIISHAPLFNELSLLSPKSHAYNPKYSCSVPELFNLFEKANIIGVIHGHHHIPASKGRNKSVRFAGRDRFVVCSIYSKINTGFPLEKILSELKLKRKMKKDTKDTAMESLKKSGPITYKHDTPVDKISGVYQEMRTNTTVFTVDKIVDGKRKRRRCANLNEAIDYLNELNKEIYKLKELRLKE